MRETICLPVIESFLRALRPSGPWTLTAIYKNDDGPPDLPVVHTADLAVIRTFCQIHAGTNLYYQANETKDVWKKASAADLASVSWVHVDIDHDEMGMPFHGKLVARARVVYVAAEGRYDIYPRFRAWCIEHGIVEAALDDWFRVCQDAVAVDDIRDSGELTCFTNAIYAVKAFMPVGFVIFDTLNKNMNGDEKDSHAMSLFVKGCELVKDAFGATVLIIHHTGHNTTRARGSSVLVSAVDVSMRCAKIEKLPHRARLTVEHIRAARGGWRMDLQTHEIQIGEAKRASTLVMRLVKEEEAIRITTRDRVLMAIATSIITQGNEVAPKLAVRALESMLEGVSGCGRTAIAKACNALREEGLLDGGYSLTPKGIERATELQNIHGGFDEDQEEETEVAA